MDELVRGVRWLVECHRTWIFFGFLGAALAAGTLAAGVRIDTRISGLLLSDDPELRQTEALKQDFSNDEVLLVVAELGRPFQPDDLRAVAALSGRLAEAPHVEEVIDLSTVEDVRGDGAGLDASDLVDLDTLEDDFDELRERVRGHRLYERLLVSDAQDVLGMIVIPDPPDASRPDASKEMVQGVRQIVAAQPLPFAVHVVGSPESEWIADALVRIDLATLAPPALGLILFLAWLAMRRAFAVVLALAVIAFSELVMLAWFGATGTPLTIATSLAPLILIAPASTAALYAVGLLHGLGPVDRPGLALVELLTPPAVLSAASTGAGFLSLRLIGVRAVAELGTGLAVGIAAGGVAAILLIPALVDRFDLRFEAARTSSRENRLGELGLRLARRPWLTLGVAAIPFALAFPGLSRIEVETDPLSYFRSDHPHIRSTEFAREHLSGTRVMTVLVETGRPGGALEPQTLAFVDALIGDVEKLPEVDRTLSFLDYVHLMDAALRPGEPPRTVLPSRALAAQYLLLYEMGGDIGDLRHFVNGDRSSLNVGVRITTVSSQFIFAVRDRVRNFASQYPEAPMTKVLGHVYLFAKSALGIGRGMVLGIAVALAIVIGVMGVALGSVRLALLGAIPNMAPVLLCTGIMGWLEIPLSLSTAVVGSIALGLAVDDTSHVLAHMRRAAPLDRVYSVVAPAMILTSACLGLGFLVLVFSRFSTVATFGIATASTVGVALLVDLLVLPSLLVCAGYPLSGDGEGLSG